MIVKFFDTHRPVRRCRDRDPDPRAPRTGGELRDLVWPVHAADGAGAVEERQVVRRVGQVPLVSPDVVEADLERVRAGDVGHGSAHGPVRHVVGEIRPAGSLMPPPRYCRALSALRTPIIGVKPFGGAFSSAPCDTDRPSTRRRPVTGENHSAVVKYCVGTCGWRRLQARASQGRSTGSCSASDGRSSRQTCSAATPATSHDPGCRSTSRCSRPACRPDRAVHPGVDVVRVQVRQNAAGIDVGDQDAGRRRRTRRVLLERPPEAGVEVGVHPDRVYGGQAAVGQSA